MFKSKASESWVGNPEQMTTSNKALKELHGFPPDVGSWSERVSPAETCPMERAGSVIDTEAL